MHHILGNMYYNFEHYNVYSHIIKLEKAQKGVTIMCFTLLPFVDELEGRFCAQSVMGALGIVFF